MEVSATVQAIDRKKGTVTLKGQDGKLVTTKVDKSVEGFDTLKVGDSIHARFTEAIAISVEKLYRSYPMPSGGPRARQRLVIGSRLVADAGRNFFYASPCTEAQHQYTFFGKFGEIWGNLLPRVLASSTWRNLLPRVLASSSRTPTQMVVLEGSLQVARRTDATELART